MANVYHALEEMYLDDNYMERPKLIGYFVNLADAVRTSEVDFKGKKTRIRRVAFHHRIFKSYEQFQRVAELDRMADLMARLSDDDIILLKQKFNTDGIDIPEID